MQGSSSAIVGAETLVSREASPSFPSPGQLASHPRPPLRYPGPSSIERRDPSHKCSTSRRSLNPVMQQTISTSSMIVPYLVTSTSSNLSIIFRHPFYAAICSGFAPACTVCLCPGGTLPVVDVLLQRSPTSAEARRREGLQLGPVDVADMPCHFSLLLARRVGRFEEGLELGLVGTPAEPAQRSAVHLANPFTGYSKLFTYLL